jgi:hypothetical protein
LRTPVARIEADQAEEQADLMEIDYWVELWERRNCNKSKKKIIKVLS